MGTRNKAAQDSEQFNQSEKSVVSYARPSFKRSQTKVATAFRVLEESPTKM